MYHARRAPAPVHPFTSGVRALDRFVWRGVAALSLATLAFLALAPVGAWGWIGGWAVCLVVVALEVAR